MPQVSEQVQANILQYCNYVLTEHNRYDDYYSKMEAVDTAYARYLLNKDPKTGVVHGEGIDAATVPVGVFNVPSTIPPVVVSQVESMVGYLSEVFLSGTPLFPVVSSPANKDAAGALEALLDTHAILGGYPRQLLIFLRDCVKYNLGAVETDWTGIDQYEITDELLAPETQKIGSKRQHYTKLKRLDLYNTVWDRNTEPGSVAVDGDYAGHIEVISRPKLKRLLNRMSEEKDAMNVNEALRSFITMDAPNYRIHPQINDYVSARKPLTSMDWGSFLGIGSSVNAANLMGNYEKLVLYARVCPADLGIPGPKRNTPQIYKFTVINGTVLVQVKRIISAYDTLPILFGQPLEDGMGYQTKSIAEGSIPIQAAAGTLFNIKFNASRRAVSDRALYDPSVINPKDVNAPVPAAKIPVKTNALNDKPISYYYQQIPFDMRGTEGAMQDGMAIVAFGKELSGLNNPMQGQFQKGNKSVEEWRDTMGGADSRLRLPALALEHQFFVPLKNILKFNIYQYGQDSIVASQTDGKLSQVNIAKLRETVMEFRLADGYTPKSRLASTDSIVQIMQMVSQSPVLQQQYGMMLPNMVAHLAQLLGVRDLEQYNPQMEQPIQDTPPAASSPLTDIAQKLAENDLRDQEMGAREMALQLRQQELNNES